MRISPLSRLHLEQFLVAEAAELRLGLKHAQSLVVDNRNTNIPDPELTEILTREKVEQAVAWAIPRANTCAEIVICGLHDQWMPWPILSQCDLAESLLPVWVDQLQQRNQVPAIPLLENAVDDLLRRGFVMAKLRIELKKQWRTSANDSIDLISRLFNHHQHEQPAFSEDKAVVKKFDREYGILGFRAASSDSGGAITFDIRTTVNAQSNICQYIVRMVRACATICEGDATEGTGSIGYDIPRVDCSPSSSDLDVALGPYNLGNALWPWFIETLYCACIPSLQYAESSRRTSVPTAESTLRAGLWLLADTIDRPLGVMFLAPCVSILEVCVGKLKTESRDLEGMGPFLKRALELNEQGSDFIDRIVKLRNSLVHRLDIRIDLGSVLIVWKLARWALRCLANRILAGESETTFDEGIRVILERGLVTYRDEFAVPDYQ